jgi:uncharacterized membrane protein HdeD (DUF308 family)
MLKALVDSWWSFAIRGVLALLFGLGALSFPGLTLLVLIVFFGIWALIDGFAALMMAFGESKRLPYILLGLLSVVVGIYALARPGATALAVIWLIGIWAVIRGVGEIMAAIHIRKEVVGEWAIALSGVISIVFGLFLLLRPGEGALALAWLIAIYAFVSGILKLMLGFKLRRMKKELDAATI